MDPDVQEIMEIEGEELIFDSTNILNSVELE